MHLIGYYSTYYKYISLFYNKIHFDLNIKSIVNKDMFRDVDGTKVYL